MVLLAVVFPYVVDCIYGTIVGKKHHWIFLASNIGVSYKISESSVSYSAAVFSVVEDDVLAHVEETLRRYFGASLVYAVEEIVMEGNICDRFKFEICS